MTLVIQLWFKFQLIISKRYKIVINIAYFSTYLLDITRTYIFFCCTYIVILQNTFVHHVFSYFIYMSFAYFDLSYMEKNLRIYSWDRNSTIRALTTIDMYNGNSSHNFLFIVSFNVNLKRIGFVHDDAY